MKSNNDRRRTVSRVVIAAAAAALQLATPVGVAAETYSIDPVVQERLETILTKSGGELKYFEGPAGMIGIGLTMANGQQMVVYATPRGEVIFSGVAIETATGANLTRADMEKMPAPDFSGVFEQLASKIGPTAAPDDQGGLFAATEGDLEAGNVYYVFIDPRCPYCHSVYNAFLAVQQGGADIVVHYLPIGILGPESQNLASAMAGSDNDAALEIFRASARRGYRFSQTEVIENGNSAAGRNLQVFRSLSFDAVPVVISRVGGKYQARQGAMDAASIKQELERAAMATLSDAR